MSMQKIDSSLLILVLLATSYMHSSAAYTEPDGCVLGSVTHFYPGVPLPANYVHLNGTIIRKEEFPKFFALLGVTNDNLLLLDMQGAYIRMSGSTHNPDARDTPGGGEPGTFEPGRTNFEKAVFSTWKGFQDSFGEGPHSHHTFADFEVHGNENHNGVTPDNTAVVVYIDGKQGYILAGANLSATLGRTSLAGGWRHSISIPSWQPTMSGGDKQTNPVSFNLLTGICVKESTLPARMENVENVTLQQSSQLGDHKLAIEIAESSLTSILTKRIPAISKDIQSLQNALIAVTVVLCLVIFLFTLSALLSRCKCHDLSPGPCTGKSAISFENLFYSSTKPITTSADSITGLSTLSLETGSLQEKYEELSRQIQQLQRQLLELSSKGLITQPVARPGLAFDEPVMLQATSQS